MRVQKYTKMLPVAGLISLALVGCRKFVEIGPPTNEIDRRSVFSNDVSAVSAMNGIYNQLISGGFASGGTVSLTYLGGLSADELDLFQTGTTSIIADTKQFYENQLLSTNSIVSNRLWNDMYLVVYKANSILEALNDNTIITSGVKSQITGEALFMRAFAYFYLINLFGDVPLTLTTDYRINATLARAEEAVVYDQITKDLTNSESLLCDDYAPFQGERAKVNKWAAKTLLARTYMYRGEWAKAESLCSEIIGNRVLFDTVSINNVFLKNSKEAIWQLARPNNLNTNEATTFIFTGTPSRSTLKGSIYDGFEKGDLRRSSWIGSTKSGTTTYYYPYKYKATTAAQVTEYSMVLRLAEVFLIRAESRINLNKIAEGISDLNIIRKRARANPTANDPVPLPDLKGDLAKDSAIMALENERRRELFTEWGHRWLDLKRWRSSVAPDDRSLARADDILKLIKLQWRKEWKLYPIPQSQIISDPSMASQQNPGYN